MVRRYFYTRRANNSNGKYYFVRYHIQIRMWKTKTNTTLNQNGICDKFTKKWKNCKICMAAQTRCASNSLTAVYPIL